MSPSPRSRRILAVLWETLWLLVLAAVTMFVFFAILGGISPGQTVGLTVVVVCLAALWVAHAAWQSRHRDPHDTSARRARERRGF